VEARAYSSINIADLACGIACCTFVVLYVQAALTDPVKTLRHD
jgi:hypothetical protein